MKNKLPAWDNIGIGTKLKNLIKSPDHKQIFMFSAITWNRHEIHYNSKIALNEGHKDVVVQRALLGNYLSQMIIDWIGENGELNYLEWKVVRSAFPGDSLTCQGEVSEKYVDNDNRIIKCEIRIKNQNSEIIVIGKSKIMILS